MNLITAPTLKSEAKFQKKLEITRNYYESPRDAEFPQRLSEQHENFKARLQGGGVKECALVVMGDSNSGKSKMLERFLATFPAWQPRIDENGGTRSPVLLVEAPGSCTTKSFAIAMLTAMGIHAASRASEFELYSVLKRALKINRYEWVIVDEMQHAIRGTKAATISKVQDVFKSLLQIDDWPIHFVFVGTFEMSRFLIGDRQLANRCKVMRILPMNIEVKGDVEFAEYLLSEIVVEAGGLKIGWATKDRMAKRVIKASSGALGALISLTQQACFRAIDDDQEVVTVQDFADTYRAKSGCIKSDNIFLSANWEAINPAKAVSDLQPAN